MSGSNRHLRTVSRKCLFISSQVLCDEIFGQLIDDMAVLGVEDGCDQAMKTLAMIALNAQARANDPNTSTAAGDPAAAPAAPAAAEGEGADLNKYVSLFRLVVPGCWEMGPERDLQPAYWVGSPRSASPLFFGGVEGLGSDFCDLDRSCLPPRSPWGHAGADDGSPGADLRAHPAPDNAACFTALTRPRF